MIASTIFMYSIIKLNTFWILFTVSKDQSSIFILLKPQLSWQNPFMEKIRLSDEFLGMAHESSSRHNNSDVLPLFGNRIPKTFNGPLRIIAFILMKLINILK